MGVGLSALWRPQCDWVLSQGREQEHDAEVCAKMLKVTGSLVSGPDLRYTNLVQRATQNMASLLTTTNATGGHSAIIQLFWEVFKGRYGSGYGAIGLAYVPLVAMFFCAYSSLCANARMLYAFSRDGAMPGARIWRRLGARSRLPANAAWLMALLALLLVVPCIFNDLFFATVSAGSVVALSLSYGKWSSVLQRVAGLSLLGVRCAGACRFTGTAVAGHVLRWEKCRSPNSPGATPVQGAPCPSTQHHS